MAKTKLTRPNYLDRRTFWPNCAVCQYLKKHKDVRERLMKSTYFNPQGVESMAAVFRDIGDPFPGSSIRTHMARHQQKDIIKAEKKYDEITVKRPMLVDVLGDGVVAKHERSLDNFILEGDAKLEAGEMPISAQNYLTAIKIKADIEKSTKDRRLDAFKTISGAARRAEPQG